MTDTRPSTFADPEGRSEPAGSILNALSDPVFLIDDANRFAYVNLAAEQFFANSAASLLGRPLSLVLPEDSPLFALIAQVRDHRQSVAEFGVSLEGPKIAAKLVSVDVAALPEMPGTVVVALKQLSIARKIDRQLTHRGAARSVTAMAAMLAHEVKNPLSGIRGAAQLIETGLDAADRELTRLICDEADRIVALVDRMEMFSDDRPIQRGPINIHEVLDHVRQIAENGFARQVEFATSYDPSLPPVLGNRDLLVQALLNLVKNAAEAVPRDNGKILLSTRYQQGVRLAVRGSDRRIGLPLMVGIQDNGPGIPMDLRPHLFDPFVTDKPNGKGLGLALVAKVVGDHGGVIEFESEPQRTLFRLMLPMASAAREEEG
jgi:two-component system nitrogen regulation sensor histidine kinase GlnL